MKVITLLTTVIEFDQNAEISKN